MNIDNLTYGELKQIANLFKSTESQTESQTETAFVIGEKYFIRTATYHVTGKLKAVFPHELVLSDAAWIADSGRLNNALKTGELSEVEPFEFDAIVSRGGIIDATPWAHDLPRTVK